MADPEDFIIDCGEVPSAERAEREIFTVDFLTDGYIPRNSKSEFVDWSGAIGKMDVDLPSPQSCPEAGIMGHPLSGPTNWTNSREEFEWDLLSIDLDPDVERAGKPHAKAESRSARPSAFFTSALVHGAFFFLFAFFPATQAAGTFGYAGNVLTATILSHEDLIPQDESPASVDSPASVPSIAKTSKKPEEPDSTEHPKESLEKVAVLEKQLEKEITNEKEDPRGDGPQNSLASMPSTASAERRFIPAAGQGGEAFDSMVLSAIREAIFFPKQAVQERQHGEVVVAFSINKDRSISSLGITKSSGLTILDEAAIKIVQKAAKKFPPFPDGLSKDTLHFVVPILFKEKGK
jgi:periplasmic protein TonB